MSNDPRLLVIGAINTDLIAFVPRAPEAGETVAGGHFEQHGGGKGANQAVAAARSGALVTLLSAVGPDEFGNAREQALLEEGIDTSGLLTVEDAASGVAVIIVEQSGENRICDLPGAREHITPERVLAIYQELRPAAILATNELPVACLRAIFHEAQTDGVPIWFNVAPFSVDARSLMSFVDTLMLNRGEAEDILGIRGETIEIDDLVGGLLDLGAKRVVVTLGGEGIHGVHERGTHRIPAEPVEVVDTTGAGDTFGGAWAAEMLRGASFEDALRYANKAAALSVTKRGAQSSIPTRAEVARMDQ